VVEYIIAITNNGHPLSELKEKCISQLRAFLGDDTEEIVFKLMNLLDVENNSNIKNNLKYHLNLMNDRVVFESGMKKSRSHSLSPNSSRKRSRKNENDVDRNDENDVDRIDERRDDFDQNEKNFGNRRFDRDDRNVDTRKFNVFNKGRNGRRRPKCRDYFELGRCDKGDNCPFEHSDRKDNQNNNSNENTPAPIPTISLTGSTSNTQHNLGNNGNNTSHMPYEVDKRRKGDLNRKKKDRKIQMLKL